MERNKIIILIIVVLAVGLIIGSFSGQAVKKRCSDVDRDGYYRGSGCGTLSDCNDKDANINPGAVDICQDGIDQNCNGVDEACTTISTSVTTVPACSDTDDGQNIFVKGTVTTDTASFTDYCSNLNLSASNVNEYYCDANGNAASSILVCPNGYSCLDGACIPV